ncbi:unnamed protein product [Rhizophagus irregularis]|nr:unnamed protein product [Rhizophagus irregularis]CAB4406946.1 unnamed protein product [Rhizophagus irregularis]CAB4407595.1 unnamed protein product [Rhizophagus irregularis]CAB4488448.1 unnamed protein product [Rhizophagus irregularis]CAB5197626.1 unnamed protein product [Rhizophagus irregularis]
MKVSIIIIKIIFVLYFIACIGTEIWYLVSLHKIGGIIIYSDILYFIGNIFLIIFVLYTKYDSDGDDTLYNLFIYTLISILASFIFNFFAIMYQKILKLRAEEDL